MPAEIRRLSVDQFNSLLFAAARVLWSTAVRQMRNPVSIDLLSGSFDIRALERQ